MPTVQYLSHSGFLVKAGGRTLLIDPFFTGNPKATVKAADVKADYILLSHGHGDHLGDGLEIAKRCKATIVAPNELAVYCSAKGATVHPMHIGGGWNFDFGRVKLTIAHHGSAAGSSGLEYTGNPCGFLVMADGKTLYHAGDTGLFYDMKLIGEMHPVDLALLPIGDNFTMGVDDAIKAVELMRPKHVVPMHYDTFDLIKADPHKFASGAERHGAKVTILKVGESLSY
jgi:L-ascorbate metabolism protein UlaG (beta-lactamase superfamily)